MKCPVCASADLVPDTRDLPYTYQGQSAVLRAVRGAFCPACGEGVFKRAEANRISAALLAFHHAVHAG